MSAQRNNQPDTLDTLDALTGSLPEPLLKEQTILTLHRMGASPYRIATELREDIVYIRRVLYSSAVSRTFVEPEDKELATAMRNLAWQANEYAQEIYEYGTPAEKFGLTKIILSRTASMIGQQTTTRYDDMRNEFEDMLGEFRGSGNILDEPPIDVDFTTDD